MSKVASKVVWIIGSSSGIGKATAIQLQNDGYFVVLSSRDEKALTQAQSDLSNPKESMISTCDVTDLESLKAAKKKILDSKNTIDLVIFAAGVYDPMPLDSYDHDQSLLTLNVNLIGAFNVFELMKQEALDDKTPLHLAWIASVAGFRGLPRSAAYGATKAALINFAEIQRVELRDKKTNVQVINPGFVKTRLTDKNSFEMPMRITSKEAAKAIVSGLKSSKFEIIFPTAFGIIMKSLRMMPNWMYLKLASKIDEKE